VRRALLLLGLLACAACSRTPRGDRVSASPRPLPSELTVIDAAPPPPPDAAGTMPPVSDSCVSDADCDVLTIEVTGEHACCPSCRTTPGNRAWADHVREICKTRPPGPCFPLGCPMGPTGPRCDNGHCIAVPKPNF